MLLWGYLSFWNMRVVLPLCSVKYHSLKSYRKLKVRMTLLKHGNRKEWSCSRPSKFFPGKKPSATIGLEVEWAPEPVWMWWTREMFCRCRKSKNDTSVVRLVPYQCADWAMLTYSACLSLLEAYIRATIWDELWPIATEALLLIHHVLFS